MELLNKKQFGAARRLLREQLANDNILTKRQQKNLLSTLTIVEINAGRPLEALKVLERRRALGSSSWAEKFDNYLEAANLLARSGRWIAARSELINLFANRNSLQWHGLLQALELFFDVEEECRKCLEPILNRACEVAAQKLGIPIPTDRQKSTVKESVRESRALYSAAAQKYQELLLRTYSEISDERHSKLVHDLQAYVTNERVGFFREQARALLARISPSSSSHRAI